MSKIDDMLKQLCPKGVEYKEMQEVCIFKRGSTITAKDVTVYEGDEIVLTYELSGDAIINDDIEFILQSDGGTAGVYDIIVIITKDNNNYEITMTNAKLTILSREE